MAEDVDAKFEKFEEDEVPVHLYEEKFVLDVGGYAGPIDVLLNLAREQKVDLTHISILELANQYLAWVEKLRQESLELAADYLVMAAWLAYLKSLLLLPESSDGEEPTGEEMAAALQFQLLRLEGMQNAGESLMSMNQLGRDFFSRGEPEQFGYNIHNSFEIKIFDLLKAYGQQAERKNIKVLRVEPSDLYSPDDGIKWLTSMLGSIPEWVSLFNFLPAKIKEDIVSRSMLASALSAALQLSKEGRIKIRQNETYGTVFIRAAH